jgi:hypothetical protein
MSRVRRYDGGTLARPVRTPEGYLRAEAHTAKVGILLYDMPDGRVRRELVTPEVLFDAASLDSARMVPLTNRHPDDLLTADTATAHAVGTVGENIRADGDLLAAPIMVTDAATIRAIEAGRQEMSWGYTCDLDETPGTHPTLGEYDAQQRERRYNHLAIVDQARAGAQARIRLDSAGNACPPFASAQGAVIASSASPPATPEPSMPVQIQIGDHRFDVAEANGSIIQQAITQALAGLQGRIDAADKAKAEALQQVVAITKHRDGIKRRFGVVLATVRSHLDGMKARMMACDECGGTGKIDGDAKCDYCDGAGSLRMHDAIKGLPVVEGQPHPDDDLAAAEEASDSGVPDRESAAEEATEVAANPEHADAAGRKQRADARAQARATACQRRADSLRRLADTRAKARAQLLAVAGKYLGADEKLDAKPDLEIRRAVVAKLAPHIDGVAQLDAAAVALLYTAEVKRADAAAPTVPALTEGDKLRQAMLGTGGTGGAGGAGTHKDGQQGYADAATAKANAWRTPKQQPVVSGK